MFKDEQISFFMSEISKNKNFYSNINSSHINKSDHVTMETRKTNNGWQFAKCNSFSNTFIFQKYVSGEFVVQNDINYREVSQVLKKFVYVTLIEL